MCLEINEMFPAVMHANKILNEIEALEAFWIHCFILPPCSPP